MKALAAALQVRTFLPAADSDYEQIERFHAVVQQLPQLRYTPPPEIPAQAISGAERVWECRGRAAASRASSLRSSPAATLDRAARRGCFSSCVKGFAFGRGQPNCYGSLPVPFPSCC